MQSADEVSRACCMVQLWQAGAHARGLFVYCRAILLLQDIWVQFPDDVSGAYGSIVASRGAGKESICMLTDDIALAGLLGAVCR